MSYVEELCKMVSGFHVPGSGGADPDIPEFGFSPEVVLYPETVGEISRVLGFASRNGIRVFPFAGGTKLFLGNPVGTVGVALSLRRLDSVLFYEPSDMVSTVECGMEVRDFQGAVGRENQVFPVDPPALDSGATVGGLVSTNLCGPMSTRYGTCRELILGIRAVRADGEILNLGGKVVKNVAGYDIPKLMAGSFGTLCVLVEATFRLYPRQPFSGTVVLGFDDHVSCSRAARTILAADVVPTCLEILGERLSSEFAAAPGAKRSLLLRFDSFEEAVVEQVKQVKEITSGDAASFVEKGEEDSRKLWDMAREFPFSPGVSFSSKLALPVTASIEVLSDIESSPALSGVAVRCLSRPARGVALVSAGGDDDEETVAAARFLENLADSLGGRIMFSGVRRELGERVKAWGDFGDALFLMKNIKRRFDPGNILPGEKIFNAD